MKKPILIPNSTKHIILLCLTGLSIRIALASVHVHFDTYAYKFQAYTLQQWTFREMYSNIPGGFTASLPFHYYILYPIGVIYKLLGFNQNTTGYLPNLLIKLPIFLAEILTAFLIWLIIKKKYSEKKAFLGAFLFLFHPAVMLVSIIIGQVDAIFLFFALLALYLLDDKKAIPSSIAFSAALLLKPQSLFIAPLYGIASLINFRLKQLLAMAITGGTIILLVFYPFTLGRDYFWLYQYIKKLADTYLFTSVYALNIWGFEGFMLSDLRTFAGITLKKWGLYIVYTLLTIFYGTTLLKRLKFRHHLLYLLALLSIYTVYLFSTRMLGGRYLIFLLAFYPIIAWQSRLFLLSWLLSSLVITLNMTHVYNEYNLPLADFISQSKLIINLLIIINFFAYSLIVVGYFRRVFKTAGR